METDTWIGTAFAVMCNTAWVYHGKEKAVHKRKAVNLPVHRRPHTRTYPHELWASTERITS